MGRPPGRRRERDAVITLMETITLPLLHDHHSHASLYAALEGCPDCAGQEPRAAWRMLRDLPRDRLSVVRGWQPDVLPLAAADLAALPPVLAITDTLHGFALSEAALPLVADSHPDLAIHRQDTPWIESHLHRLFDACGRFAGLDEAKLGRWMARAANHGFGSMDDMAVINAEAIRLIRASPYARRLALWATPAVLATLAPGEHTGLAGIKIFLDGDIGAGTAAIQGSWFHGGSGLLNQTTAALTAQLAELAALQLPLAFHALGERAIDQALTVIERLDRDGIGFPAVRLEHAQFITGPLAQRARIMGVILSMQPVFSGDSIELQDRLGPERRGRNNPLRMLIDRFGFVPGWDLRFGTDGMPEDLARAADLALFPDLPGQRLAIDELLAGHGRARGIDGHLALAIDPAGCSLHPVQATT